VLLRVVATLAALTIACSPRQETAAPPVAKPLDAASALPLDAAAPPVDSLDAIAADAPAVDASPADAGVAAVRALPRCTLRITAKSVFIDGDPTSESEAIRICKERGTAMVTLADGASKNVWKRMHAALLRLHVRVLMRGTLGDVECLDNPLAKGCI